MVNIAYQTLRDIITKLGVIAVNSGETDRSFTLVELSCN